MSERWVKISDYLWFQEGPGVRKHQYRENGVKLLNVANLSGGVLDISNTSRYISEEEAYGKYKHFLVDEGDFIIASSGIKVDYFDEKMGFAKADDLPLCMNTSTIRFKVLDPAVLDIKYFMYYLKSSSFKKQLARQITGSAQLNFGPSHLKKMSFPYISPPDQRAIVQRLEEIDLIFNMYRRALEYYDQLVKSRFVEMFGNQQYPEYELGSRLKTTSGGTPSRKHPEYFDGGTIPWLTSGEVNKGRIAEPENFITALGLENSSAKLTPANTVVVAMYGATAGQVGIVEYETTTNQAVCCIAPANDFEPVFLRFALESKKAWMIDQCSGGAQPNISQGVVKRVLIPDVPIKLQHEFAAFVAQVDKSEFAVQQAIEQLETLKVSLMQEYFG